jgi:hypothetical protein
LFVFACLFVFCFVGRPRTHRLRIQVNRRFLFLSNKAPRAPGW